MEKTTPSAKGSLRQSVRVTSGKKPIHRTAKKTTVKEIKKAPSVKKIAVIASAKKDKKLPYIYSVGKRKSATARVRVHHVKTADDITVNNKKHTEYFPYFEFSNIVEQPLKKLNLLGKYSITVRVLGGGKRAQAEAVRHGIARALLQMDESVKKTLRGEGYLTRDPREKERKKPGLKRARRAPQFSKR